VRIVPKRTAMAIKSGAVLILAGLVLTACASQQERAAKRAAAEQASGVDRANRCASCGYKLGTPDYSHCLENMYVQDQQKAAADEAQRAARLQAAAAGMQQAGAALSASNELLPAIQCGRRGGGLNCRSGPEERRRQNPPFNGGGKGRRLTLGLKASS
jgi:hypothetical protein